MKPSLFPAPDRFAVERPARAAKAASAEAVSQGGAFSALLLQSGTHNSALPTPQVQTTTRVYPEPVVPENIAEPVLACVRQNAPTLQVRLHPPDLGPMTVSVTVDDTLIRLDMEAASQGVVDRLRNSMPTLQRSLSLQGLTLGECVLRVSRKPFSDTESSP